VAGVEPPVASFVEWRVKRAASPQGPAVRVQRPGLLAYLGIWKLQRSYLFSKSQQVCSRWSMVCGEQLQAAPRPHRLQTTDHGPPAASLGTYVSKFSKRTLDHSILFRTTWGVDFCHLAQSHGRKGQIGPKGQGKSVDLSRSSFPRPTVAERQPPHRTSRPLACKIARCTAKSCWGKKSAAFSPRTI